MDARRISAVRVVMPVLLAMAVCLLLAPAVPAQPAEPRVAAVAFTTWYFAEGYTGPGFEEYLTLQNANPATAEVQVYYYDNGGASPPVTHYVPADSRYTIYVNADAGEGRELSVYIISNLPVVVERPMYFLYQGRYNGGHVGRGAGQPAPEWYFAEGYTGPGFDEYLTLFNRNNFACHVDIEYMIRGGDRFTRGHTVAAASRYTVKVNDDAGERLELSARVSSSRDDDHTVLADIVAERPIYFLFGGTIDGGSVCLGSTTLGPEWYFAEGYTGDYFQEYLTIMNPGDSAAKVAITYFTDDGPPIPRPDLTVPAHGRETVLVNTDVGAGRNVSTYVKSDQDILVERPIYFSFVCGNLKALGGDVAMGSQPTSHWYAAEGYTGPEFYEYLTVLNQKAAPVTITVTYFLTGEAALVRDYVIPASSRYTIQVNGEIGPDKECSLEVTTNDALLRVVLERPMYFLYQGLYNGGHISTGYPQ